MNLDVGVVLHLNLLSALLARLIIRNIGLEVYVQQGLPEVL